METFCGIFYYTKTNTLQIDYIGNDSCGKQYHKGKQQRQITSEEFKELMADLFPSKIAFIEHTKYFVIKEGGMLIVKSDTREGCIFIILPIVCISGINFKDNKLTLHTCYFDFTASIDEYIDEITETVSSISST